MKYLKKVSRLIGMAIILSSLFLLIRSGLISVNAAQDNVSKAFLPKDIVKQRVDSVMKTLSLREKIAQLIHDQQLEANKFDATLAKFNTDTSIEIDESNSDNFKEYIAA